MCLRTGFILGTVGTASEIGTTAYSNYQTKKAEKTQAATVRQLIEDPVQ